MRCTAGMRNAAFAIVAKPESATTKGVVCEGCGLPGALGGPSEGGSRVTHHGPRPTTRAVWPQILEHKTSAAAKLRAIGCERARRRGTAIMYTATVGFTAWGITPSRTLGLA